MSVSPDKPSPRRRGRRYLLIGVLLIAVGGVAAALGGIALHHRYRSLLNPVGDGELRAFEVRRGEGPGSIATQLAEAGLIRNPRAFRLRARERQVDRRLQAGWYRIAPSDGVDAILDRLVAGDVATRTITLPEGLTIPEIAERVAAAGIGSAADYRTLAGQPGWFGLDGLPDGATLEGYLYPDTYNLALDAGPRELIATQTERFGQVWAELTADRGPPRKRHAIVTIASMVEEEARHDDERARIAGVIENRLEAGRRLEICATVIYALGEHRERLLERDLRVDSPYNTYRHAGLPPGPIASPGRASLRAALEPESHHWFYYVLGRDGRHVFSHDYRGHQRAKAQAERERRER